MRSEWNGAVLPATCMPDSNGMALWQRPDLPGQQAQAQEAQLRYKKFQALSVQQQQQQQQQQQNCQNQWQPHKVQDPRQQECGDWPQRTSAVASVALLRTLSSQDMQQPPLYGQLQPPLQREPNEPEKHEHKRQRLEDPLQALLLQQQQQQQLLHAQSQSQRPLQLPPGKTQQLQLQRQQHGARQPQPPLLLPPALPQQNEHRSQPPLQLPPERPQQNQSSAQPPLQLPFQELQLPLHGSTLQALYRDQHILDAEVRPAARMTLPPPSPVHAGNL